VRRKALPVDKAFFDCESGPGNANGANPLPLFRLARCASLAANLAASHASCTWRRD
jgi:hypothetical protein